MRYRHDADFPGTGHADRYMVMGILMMMVMMMMVMVVLMMVMMMVMMMIHFLLFCGIHGR